MICKSSARLTKPAAPRWMRGVLTLAAAACRDDTTTAPGAVE